jgi:hypothetical protein
MAPPTTRASVMLRIAVAVVLLLQCCNVIILASRPLSDPGDGNQDWRDPGYSGVDEIGYQP